MHDLGLSIKVVRSSMSFSCWNACASKAIVTVVVGLQDGTIAQILDIFRLNEHSILQVKQSEKEFFDCLNFSHTPCRHPSSVWT